MLPLRPGFPGNDAGGCCLLRAVDAIDTAQAGRAQSLAARRWLVKSQTDATFSSQRGFQPHLGYLCARVWQLSGARLETVRPRGAENKRQELRAGANGSRADSHNTCFMISVILQYRTATLRLLY